VTTGKETMSEGTDAMPVGSASTDELGVLSSGAPRVEACIEAVMAKHPTIGGRADQRYFEAVHQELAPLARELERLADSEGTRAVNYLRRARKAEELLRRCSRHLIHWAEWYGNADHAARGQLPLPPAGYVRLAEDIAEHLTPNVEVTGKPPRGAAGAR
jgi:hypothetical protein